MGWVTRVSTSSGASPGASVRMTTVGLVKSGSTSTGSTVAVLNPKAMIRIENPMMIARLASDQ